MPSRSKLGFVRDFMFDFLEKQFIYGGLSQDEYLDAKASLGGQELRRLRDSLFEVQGRKVTFPGMSGAVKLISLREPDLREFWFIQFVPPRAGGNTQIDCFVGHRFRPDFERSFRFNLRHLLDPYRIRLTWAGFDLNGDDLLRDIIRNIGQSDMCIFDNLGTLDRPNVYIEAGMACVLDRPTVFCEYVGRRNRVVDTGTMPSDLAGLLRVQYKNYEDLCRQLYFGIPHFLSRHGLL